MYTYLFKHVSTARWVFELSNYLTKVAKDGCVYSEDKQSIKPYPSDKV